MTRTVSAILLILTFAHISYMTGLDRCTKAQNSPSGSADRMLVLGAQPAAPQPARLGELGSQHRFRDSYWFDRYSLVRENLSLSAFVARAARHAQFQSGNYQPSELGKLPQTTPPELSIDSTYSVPGYPLYPPDLTSGDGKQETEAYCALCHSPRYITMQPPLPAATWETEINKMNKTFGANIPEAVSQKILRYLQTHYTPDTRTQ